MIDSGICNSRRPLVGISKLQARYYQQSAWYRKNITVPHNIARPRPPNVEKHCTRQINDKKRDVFV